jgi:germination protein M
LEQLIAGPKEEDHYATIPPETKIMDVTTTSDGVCYVNLSQEFVTKHSGGSTGELLTIYSIVNSLSEMENVEKVQFLIEGEKVEAFKGHVDFSTPFVPVKSLKTVDVAQNTTQNEEP